MAFLLYFTVMVIFWSFCFGRVDRMELTKQVNRMESQGLQTIMFALIVAQIGTLIAERILHGVTLGGFIYAFLFPISILGVIVILVKLGTKIYDMAKGE